MNRKQDLFDDRKKSLYVENFATKSKRPVLYSCENKNRMVEESRRARLISQIVGKPDKFLTKDFTSSYQCPTRDTGPPQFATSHKIRTETETIPTYQSLVQSLRWSPYVEISSAENSQTNLMDKPKFNCRCETCAVKNCPSKVASSSTLRPVVFKDNIMTFSDRCTMTPRLNDVCCGVCTPIPTMPKTSDVSVPPDVAVRDTETITYFPMSAQKCGPIPILKWPACNLPASYENCGHSTGHIPVEIRQEAVRDTDVGEDYCEPIKPKSLKAFFRPKQKKFKQVVEAPPCIPEYGRRIIYNEGISDSVANNCHKPPMRAPSPVNVQRECSRVSVNNRDYMENYDSIPFSHRSDSKYHHSCKKQNLKPFYCTDTDELRHVVESPVLRKTLPSRPIRHYSTFPITLPKKVLTSEGNIDSYIDKGQHDIATETARCNRYTKWLSKC